MDVDPETKKGLLQIDPSIASYLKPHQIEGVKFVWDSVFENTKMIAEGHSGSGCILAHCMGLGKTLQMVALVHTLIVNKELTKINRVLVLMPVNVIMNWRNEFNIWTQHCSKRVSMFDLNNNSSGVKDLTRARVSRLERWFEVGGVFFMGYNMFARLVQGKYFK